MFSPTSVFHTLDFSPSVGNESRLDQTNMKAQPGTLPDPPEGGLVRRLMAIFDAAADKPTSQNSPAKDENTTMDVKDVYFTQSTIQATFGDGSSLEKTVDKIKDGDMSIDDLATIRVVEVDGTYYSLDNRRLHVMKSALKGKREENRQIKVEVVKLTDVHPKHPDQTILDEFKRKMTSVSPGGIRIKDGIKNWVPREGPSGGMFIFDKDQKKVYISQLSTKKKLAIVAKDPSLKGILGLLDESAESTTQKTPNTPNTPKTNTPPASDKKATPEASSSRSEAAKKGWETRRANIAAKLEEQQKQEAAAERQRQADAERQRQADAERQRLADAERQRQADAERQRQAAAERQRQADAERQRQAAAERQRQADAERQRQAVRYQQQRSYGHGYGGYGHSPSYHSSSHSSCSSFASSGPRINSAGRPIHDNGRFMSYSEARGMGWQG